VRQILPLPEFDSLTIQPVVRCYTDCHVPPPHNNGTGAAEMLKNSKIVDVYCVVCVVYLGTVYMPFLTFACFGGGEGSHY